jgi:hypothetical protein
VCVYVMGVCGGVWCVCIFIFSYIYMLPFQTENGSPGDFSLSVYRLLIVQSEVLYVVRLFVDEETNRSYPFANEISGLNRLNGLNGLVHLELLDSLVRCVV